MPKIIGQTSVKLVAFSIAACVAMGGILSPAALTQFDKAVVRIDDAQVPLYGKPTGGYVCMPITSGTTTYKNERATLDASNVLEGYIMVKYTGSIEKIKIQIARSGSRIYTYGLNNSDAYGMFPLSEGSGSYQVEVFKDIQGDQYSWALSQSINTEIINQFGPPLCLSQYADFNAVSVTVQTGAAVAAGVSDQIGAVAAIYNYVIDNVSYDTAKATSVQSGYLSNADVVLAQEKGVRFDYAALMTVVLRSQDIPTKLVVSYTGDLYHAWINVYLEGQDWVDNIIYLDRNNWRLMDPILVPSSGQSREIMQYIDNDANYKAECSY